jgi:site-specific DNA-cytosine methylase
LKYAGIVPLIGGMVLGMHRALGYKPEFMLSYEAFSSNDSWIREYFSDVPFHLMDDEDEIPEIPEVEVVSALCPCAGLSQLNSASSRGSYAPQNEWMYKSSELVLEKISPMVLWGENAPALFAGNGKPVVSRLRDIADKHGYSFSLIKTDTSLHGIPQKRQRTFYFFWKSENVPILEWKKRPMRNLNEYLRECEPYLDAQEVEKSSEELSKNTFFSFFKHKYGKEWRKPMIAHRKSMMDIIFIEKLFPEFSSYCEKTGKEGDLKRAMHAKSKREMGKNFWEFSPYMPVDNTGALNGAHMNAIHPYEERFYVSREFSHLMCIPNDMKIPVDAPGKIFQNVPAATVADWTLEVKRFVEGKTTSSGRNFLKQDNISQKIFTEEKSTTLFG